MNYDENDGMMRRIELEWDDDEMRPQTPEIWGKGIMVEKTKWWWDL